MSRDTSPTTADVRRSITEQGLALELVPDDEASRLYASIETRFSSSQGARWIWEQLKTPGSSRQFTDDRAYERLGQIVPSDMELLFFPGSDEEEKTAFRGPIEAIVAVIADCSPYEYIVAPLGAEWFVCENHHGVLVAVGEPVQSRLRSLG